MVSAVRVRRGGIRISAILIAALIFLCGVASDEATGDDARGEAVSPGSELYSIAEGIVKWRKSEAGVKGNLLSGQFLKYAGSSAGDWFPFGIGRLGIADDYGAYLRSLRENVEDRYMSKGQLDANKATEWHRVSLAMLAAGGDPVQAGTVSGGAVIDLIRDGVYDRGRTEALGAQGLNGLIWGLISLDAMRYKVPDGASISREDIVADILSRQLSDGSFSLEGTEGSVDITAMALTALAPYYNSEEKFSLKASASAKKKKKVRDAVDASIKWLSANQTDGGDFISWGDANSESVSQMIVALCALGIDPADDKRFMKNGASLVDSLLKFRKGNGCFAHLEGDPEDAPSNLMASEQALYAIAAVIRLKEGRRSLFDFRPEMAAETRAGIDALEGGISLLSEKDETAGKDVVLALFNDYKKIPGEERSYLRGYKKLAGAMDALGIKNDSEPLSGYMSLNDGGAGAITAVLGGADMKPELESIAGAAARTDAEIESINKGVMDNLYPFDKISQSDKGELDAYVSRIEKLDEADRERVSGYRELLKAKERIGSYPSARMIIIIVCAIGALLLALLLIRRRRRSLKDE
jgi:hypothetical protein